MPQHKSHQSQLLNYPRARQRPVHLLLLLLLLLLLILVLLLFLLQLLPHKNHQHRDPRRVAG